MEARETVADFGQAHFGAAALSDQRRTQRLLELAEKIMLHPIDTWPNKLSASADLEAFYRLMNRLEVTHATILAAHQQRTLGLMSEQSRVVLILHDTTELDYSGLKSIDLAPIGNGHGRGYLRHNSLAVTAAGEVLGLVNQILFRRPRRSKRLKQKDSAKRREPCEKSPRGTPSKCAGTRGARSDCASNNTADNARHATRSPTDSPNAAGLP